MFACAPRGLTTRSSCPLRHALLGRSRAGMLFSFRGQATHTSAVSLARTLGIANHRNPVRRVSRVLGPRIHALRRDPRRTTPAKSLLHKAPVFDTRISSRTNTRGLHGPAWSPSTGSPSSPHPSALPHRLVGLARHPVCPPTLVARHLALQQDFSLDQATQLCLKISTTSRDA